MTTKTAEERWAQHQFDAQSGMVQAFKRAIRKYGPHGFKVETIFESSDAQELFEQEKIEIARRGTTTPHGYNMTFGGEGCRLTEEARVKHADSQRQRFADPEERQRYSERTKAQFASKVARDHIAEKGRKRFADPEERQRYSERTKAQFADPEERQKASARMVEVMGRPEVKERQFLKQGVPRVLVEGNLYASMTSAGRAVSRSGGTVSYRVKIGWYFSVPRHGDPECDAVEECWALMQWAAANPDHANVPDWLQPDRPKHGVAPAWAKRAAA